MHREAFTPEGVSQALADLCQNSVELIIIMGDGTVQAALTAIGNDQIYPTPPSSPCCVPGPPACWPGMSGSQALLRQPCHVFSEWAKSTNSQSDRSDAPGYAGAEDFTAPTSFGMFFGAALFAGDKDLPPPDNPWAGAAELMPAFTMLRLLLAILAKNYEKVVPLLTRTRLNGSPAEQRLTLVLISTLERLFLGMRPYWEKKMALALHGRWCRTQKSAAGSAFLVPIAAESSCTPTNGYFSHNVQEVQLEMAGDFTLDGELYAAGKGPITIDLRRNGHFLC